MDLKEQQNVFRLLWEGLLLVNRSGLVLALYIFLAILLNAVGWVGLHFGVAPIFVKLYNFVISAFLVVLLFRVLAAKADNFGESFSNSISASVFPTIYIIIFNILFSIFGIVMALLSGMVATTLKLPGQVAILLIILFIFIRVVFAFPAIAVKEQGPIKAILYSWELTRGKNLIRTIALFLLMEIIAAACVGAIVRTLYVVIPLYYADSFNITALTPEWYAVGIGCLLLFIGISFWMTATMLLFFLNCDYGENRGSYTPTAQAELFDQQTQVFGADNNVLPANLGKPVHPEDLPSVSVVKSSVKTGQDAPNIQEHLDQVYQPQPNDVVEYADEDRMPTILFDDDTARQIEANRQLWEKKQEEPKKDEGEDTQTIKMSK